jgi:hypothetical protein
MRLLTKLTVQLVSGILSKPPPFRFISDRYLCMYKSMAAQPAKLTELKIFEIIHGLRLLKHCICDNVTLEQPFIFTSSTNIVEVQFTVTNLHMSDDYLAVYFTAQYNLSR